VAFLDPIDETLFIRQGQIAGSVGEDHAVDLVRG
jgi:hypothetical protein